MDRSPLGHRHTVGITRREWLQIGYSGLAGIGLPSLLAGRAAGATLVAPSRAKSVILIFLTGGPSHIDSFDMKPDAPQAIRGPFQPIATAVPSVTICEYLPGLAARFDRLALIRSMTHGSTLHESQYLFMTGLGDYPAGFTGLPGPHNWPCYAAVLNHLRPRHDGVVNGVMLPCSLTKDGHLYPGQDGGWLGPQYNPWTIEQEPHKPAFQVESFSRPIGLTTER